MVDGRYELLEHIGQGGFGVVFRTRDVTNENIVALKMLLPHAVSVKGVPERFQREVQLASQLTHASSVAVYDHGEYSPEPNSAGLPYLVMELLKGKTLKEHLRGVRRMTVEDTIAMLVQTLGSLAEAHDRGIVHRDIKPDNIFLCDTYWENGQRVVKVLDFGIAKAISGNWDDETYQKLTKTGTVAGTPDYMAPEQAVGDSDISPALDIYAIGCVAFEMITGRVPYIGKTPMETAFKHISEAVPELPEPFNEHFIGQVIYRAMSKEPSQRFMDASHMKRALEQGVLTQMFDMSDLLQYQATLAEMPAQTPLASAQITPNTLDALQSAPKDTPLTQPVNLQTVPEDNEGVKLQVWMLVAAAVLIPLLLGVGYSVVNTMMAKDDGGAATAQAPDKAQPAAPKPDQDKPKEAKGAGADPKALAQNDPTPKEDKNGQPQADPENKGDQADPAKPVKEAPTKEEPKNDLQQEVKLVTNTSAIVYNGVKKIGTTPMTLKSADFDGKPVVLRLRAQKHRTVSVTVDWSKPRIATKLAPQAKSPPVNTKGPSTPTPKPGILD